MKKVPVTTEKLNEISGKASDIIQKNAEVVGILKVIDLAVEQLERSFDDDVVWALRSATRSLESAIEDAAHITDTIEHFEEIK